MPNKDTDEYYGPLTAPWIIKCRDELKDIIIAPFSNKKAKGIGYNLSPSELIYSLRKKGLMPICHDSSGSYIKIRSHDTILILSYEYLQVNNNICGTFHSRVRGSAKGMGNVSTTLDPGWKGMLLFSINNPTKRSIRLDIFEKKDGQIENSSLLTLAPFRMRTGDDVDLLTFHLDNPPMRADIWDELIEPPHRFCKNREYQKFKGIIRKVIEFKPVENDTVKRINTLLDLLIDLKCTIVVDENFNESKKTLIHIQRMITEENKTLKEKIERLEKEVTKKRSERGIIIELIDSVIRECQYIRMCDEVNQLHKFIHENVESVWKRRRISQIFFQFIYPNLGAILSSFILLIILFGFYWIPGIEFLNSLSRVAISIIPTIVSIIFSFAHNKK